MSIKENNVEQVAVVGEKIKAGNLKAEEEMREEAQPTSIEIAYFAEEGRNQKRVVLTLSNSALPELVSEWRQKLAQGRYDSYMGTANEEDVLVAGCGLREKEIVPVLNKMIVSWNSAMPCEPRYTRNFLYANAYRIAEVAADFMRGKPLTAEHLVRYDIESVEVVIESVEVVTDVAESEAQYVNPFVLTRPGHQHQEA